MFDHNISYMLFVSINNTHKFKHLRSDSFNSTFASPGIESEARLPPGAHRSGGRAAEDARGRSERDANGVSTNELYISYIYIYIYIYI